MNEEKKVDASKQETRVKKSLSEKFFEAKGKQWIVLYLLFIHVLLVFITVVYYLIRAYSTINAILLEEGIEVDIVLIIVIFWSALLAYAVILCTRAFVKIAKNGKIKPNGFNRAFPFIIIILFVLFYAAVVELVETSSIAGLIVLLEFAGLLALVEATIVIFAFMKVFIVALRRLHRSSSVSRHKKRAALITLLTLYVIVMVLPYMIMPTNVIPGPLPSKPEFILHKGGPLIGPENTIECAEANLPFGAIGWEIDIRMSLDGVPFLMHDETLLRTTNVATVFPGRKMEPAASFTWAELQQLDAGSYFFDDPNIYTARDYVPAEKIEEYRGAKIPSLNDSITKSIEWNWMIDANIKGVPDGHPYASTFQSIVLDMLVNSSLTTVFLGGRTEIVDPKVKHVSSNTESSPGTLVAEGYDILCTDFITPDPTIRSFVDAGFPVYLQTINTMIEFSAAWAIGASYVLTDTACLFEDLTAPVWYLTSMAWYSIWLAVHIAMGMIAFALVYNRRSSLKK
ncbi:MAG: glycerophosphodiester phosphodiesterase family protein [Candidatus Hodarchaeota archaeon]